MSNRERLSKERVNFFDGQKVTENDLDTEQIYHQTVASEMVTDFHADGVINFQPFVQNILLDTRYPGNYSKAGQDNPSKLDIDAGRYDGKGVYLDLQPSDIVRGTRMVIELVNVNIIGRNRPKILIVGNAFNGTDSSGILTHEFIEFEENGKKVTSNYYQKVIAVFFNNFSGGTGKTEYLASAESLDLISLNGGYAIFSEAEPLTVFAKPIVQSQTLSPSFDMANFITSSTSNDISTEISLALDATSNINDLYYDLESKSQIKFEKNQSVTVAYGQKFLAKSNNLQRIDLLLSVQQDSTRPVGTQYDWSGDLVLGIYEIASDVKCPTDAVPDELIKFDPALSPILEVSFGQDDFEDFGYKLNSTPQIVSFNFAGTLLADPNLEPSLKVNKFYAFIISRRGANTVGTIVLEKGYENIQRKQDLGIELSLYERFAKSETRYFEFDPYKGKYIDDSTSTLWFKIYSDTFEVMSGAAYSTNGKAILIPKTQKYIGGNEISYFEDKISLANVASGAGNYVILNHIEKFTTPDTHPISGNFVFTRIQDGASATIVDNSELTSLLEDETPLILAKITDNNSRDGVDISGQLDKPGQIQPDKIIIFNPSSTLLNTNLVGRLVTPDTDCNCASRYRVAEVICRQEISGDLDNDGSWTYNDISDLINIAGNTINSSVTERAILGGDLDIVDFVKSDLNNDGTVDGFDIDLLEGAVDGYVNFTISEKINILELILENVTNDNDYPTIFTDVSNTGNTTSGSNLIDFTTATSNEALAIRVGDTIEIPSTVLDEGSYVILSKTIGTNNLDVQVEVSTLDGNPVSFVGSGPFNLVVISGTRVNTYADNLTLLNVPYTSKNYKISFANFPFTTKFVEVCDLRRFIDTAFTEQISEDPCACPEPSCLPAESCQPVIKTQHYFPGDVYLPNGNILSAPGVPHHGDYEYVNVLMPVPPGTISDCAVNLYETFVKLDSDCKTAAGFPAMQYSDGTYVGCDDTGSVTDLSLGRVKFSHAIASLYVDALVDGYAVDGYANAEISSENQEAIFEEFKDYSYVVFDSWIDNPFNDITFGTVTHPSGLNEAAVFDVTTISSASQKYVRLGVPAESQNFAGDFVVDFTAKRLAWPQATLTSGTVSAFATFEISNLDGSSATLKLGWRAVGGSTTKLFYNGVIRNNLSVTIDSFDHLIETPDALGEDLLFRVRRVNDTVFAYYIIPGQINETLGQFGQYIRIGTNPTYQPGTGTVMMDFEMSQESSPNAGKNFIVNLEEVVIRSEYVTSSATSAVSIGRSSVTDEINRLTCNFPINLTSKTNIVSAVLKLTSSSSTTITDQFNVIPLAILDASNLGLRYNVPQTQEVSYITTFSPGTITVGGALDIDITNSVIGLIATPGNLPGFVKGFIIEPTTAANSFFSIDPEITLLITYEEVTTGVIFQVGVSINPQTGIATLNTKNILYDAIIEENRTVINFGVHLKKSGFRNQDRQISINDLSRIGIGTCKDETVLTSQDDCYFVVGSSATGTFVEGPFPCIFANA